MILGLYGESRSGKDTIARIFQDNHNYEWRAFANTLRTILLDIDPYLPEMDQHLVSAVAEWGWDVVKARSTLSVDMMISLGQSARDNIHEDVWVWPVFTNIPERMVISDVRQPNEHKAIINAGGEVWKIVRPGTKKRGMDGLLDHLDFPVSIYNNGNITDLESIIKKEIDDLPNRRD